MSLPVQTKVFKDISKQRQRAWLDNQCVHERMSTLELEVNQPDISDATRAKIHMDMLMLSNELKVDQLQKAPLECSSALIDSVREYSCNLMQATEIQQANLHNQFGTVLRSITEQTKLQYMESLDHIVENANERIQETSGIFTGVREIDQRICLHQKD